MAARRLPSILAALTAANLALTSTAFYALRGHHVYNLEQHEARMDELEGTLRGHIGIIEDSLERVEKKLGSKEEGGSTEAMSKKSREMYESRGRDEKGSEGKR